MNEGKVAADSPGWETLWRPRDVGLTDEAQRRPINQVGRERVEEAAQEIGGTSY